LTHPRAGARSPTVSKAVANFPRDDEMVTVLVSTIAVFIGLSLLLLPVIAGSL
jgi:hypothetical protein